MARKKDISPAQLRDELHALIRKGEARNSKHAQKWAEKPVEFIEDFNIKITEKIEDLILSINDPSIRTLVVLGVRGSGKTLVVTTTCGAKWAFDEDDVLQMGGSEWQAALGYTYLTNYFLADEAFKQDYKDSKTSVATGHRGNWYKIGPSSQTFLRGPHVGDPHREMGNEIHGGILVIDEEGVVKPSIVTTALPIAGDANPSKKIRMSTNQEESGTFADLIDDPAGHGVDKVIELDSFDVAETCKDKCVICMPQFAGPLNKKEYIQWAADVGKQPDNPDRPRGYCEGKAKEGKPGHKRIDQLKHDFKEMGPSGFEQEFTLNKNKTSGKIIPRVWLDKCLSGQNQMIRPINGRPTAFLADPSPAFTAYFVLQMQNDFRVAVLDAEHVINEHSDEKLIDVADAMIRRNHCNFGYGDAAYEWLLSQIARRAGLSIKLFRFLEKSKLDSIGMTKKLFEDTRIIYPGIRKGKEYYFPKPSLKTAFEQLAGWHRKNGIVVKEKDDYPDALCTGAKAFLAGSFDDQPIIIERDDSNLPAPPSSGFDDNKGDNLDFASLPDFMT